MTPLGKGCSQSVPFNLTTEQEMLAILDLIINCTFVHRNLLLCALILPESCLAGPVFELLTSLCEEPAYFIFH